MSVIEHERFFYISVCYSVKKKEVNKDQNEKSFLNNVIRRKYIVIICCYCFFK